MSKHIDSVNMNFNADNQANVDKPLTPPPTPPKSDDIETKEFDGKKVYERNKSNGNVKYFDTEGKEVDVDVVTVLEEKNVTIPEFSPTGAEKEGDLEVREVEYPEQGKENVQGERVFIAERQKYKDGDSWTATTPKNQYNIVKFLRGEQSG